MALSLQVSTKDAMVAQFAAPASWPAKRAFFRFNAMGRMVRSTALLSISIRPSARKRQRPAQYFAMYFNASPKGALTEMRARWWVSQVSKAAIFGADWSWRMARRASDDKPLISASIL